jgi:hypothetical protein
MSSSVRAPAAPGGPFEITVDVGGAQGPKSYLAHVEHDLPRGRSYYKVDGLGTITVSADTSAILGPDDPAGEPVVEPADRVRLYWGRYDSDKPYHEGTDKPLPKVPRVHGVDNFVGSWVFNPDTVRSQRGVVNAHAERPSRVSYLGRSAASSAARLLLGEVGMCLVAHWRAQPEHAALVLAWRTGRAGYWRSRHAGSVAELERQLADVQARLARARDLLAVQRDYENGTGVAEQDRLAAARSAPRVVSLVGRGARRGWRRWPGAVWAGLWAGFTGDH